MKSAPDKDSQQLAGTIARYASSNLFRHVLGVVNAFLKPKLLSPELLGLWSLLSLIPNFAPYIHLGSRTAMRYRLPQYLAQGDEASGRNVLGAVYYGSLVLNLLVALALIFYPFMGSMERAASWGLWSMAGIVMMTWYFEYQVAALKAYEDFTLLSRANYLRAGLLSLFNVVLILLFGIYGLYAALLLSTLLTGLYLHVRHSLPAPGPYRHQVFTDLVKQGFPIMLYNFSGLIVASSDKLIISSMLGLKQLGYYGIAAMTLNFLMQVPGASREVVESKLMVALHEDKEQALQQYLLRPLLVSAYLVPFFIGPAVFFLPVVVESFLPTYIPGVLAAQILLFGGYPLTLSYVLRGGIVALEIQRPASLLMVLAAIANLVFSWLLVQAGWGISGVALASSCSFFLLFSLQAVLLKKRLGMAHLNFRWPEILLPLLLSILLCTAGSFFTDLLKLPEFLAGCVLSFGFALVMLQIHNRAAIRTGAFHPLSLKFRRKQ